MAVVVADELDEFLAAGIARASRRADMVASVPEETMRIISMDGMSFDISSARAISPRQGAP